MSEPDATSRQGGPDGDQAPGRSTEDVAREIGTAGTGGAHRHAGDDESLREGGRLRLDKSGALAGRPKLRPVRPHRKEADAAEHADAAASREDVRTAGPRKAALPPRLGALRPQGAPEEAIAAAAAGEDDEVGIPGGTFLYGEGKRPKELPAFSIDRAPVTNAAYALFVRATGHRPPLYWKGGGFPELLADHPVVGVDYYDALAYARWRGKDLPYEDEWERAARGTDGRVFPWGDDPELSGANTARVGIKCTVPVDLHRENVSPDGVRDLVGNVWELTHSPAPGGGVVVRGGSWYDFALYAKTYFRFASRPDARNGTIGFRCVRREVDREGAPREVTSAKADAEIAARQGEQPPVDASGWNVEKRDLVPDLQRLHAYVLETRAEVLLGARVPAPSAAPSQAAVAEREPAVPDPAVPDPAVPDPAVSDPAVSGVGQRTATPQEDEPPAAPSVEEGSADEGPAEVEAETPTGEPVSAAISEGPEPPLPATAVPAGEASRIHVGSAGPRDPIPGTTFEVEKAASAVARGEVASKARRVTARGPRSMPVTLWVLLCLGFVLFGGLLFVLLGDVGGESPPAAESDVTAADIDEPEVAPRSPVADLPETASYDEMPGAGEPPRVLDAAYASDRGRLDTGFWLLLIIDPESDEGVQTLRTAHALHRRLAPHGVNVTVVLPRTPYETEDGRLVDDDQLDVALRESGRNWLWDGIHVVLDPKGEDGRGLLAGKYSFEGDPVAAMLLRDGVIERRTAPPEGGFTEASLASLALRALELEQGGR